MEGGALLEKVFMQDLWRRGRNQPHKGVHAGKPLKGSKQKYDFMY